MERPAYDELEKPVLASDLVKIIKEGQTDTLFDSCSEFFANNNLS